MSTNTRKCTMKPIITSWKVLKISCWIFWIFSWLVKYPSQALRTLERIFNKSGEIFLTYFARLEWFQPLAIQTELQKKILFPLCKNDLHISKNCVIRRNPKEKQIRIKRRWLYIHNARWRMDWTGLSDSQSWLARQSIIWVKVDPQDTGWNDDSFPTTGVERNPSFPRFCSQIRAWEIELRQKSKIMSRSIPSPVDWAGWQGHIMWHQHTEWHS